jgi:FkbM family methyltransferase
MLSFIRDPNHLISQNYILSLGKLIQNYKLKKREREKKKGGGDQNITKTYLEVGAFDGITQSNTLVLQEQLGWSGILVEPINSYYQLLKKNRPNNIFINSLLHSLEGKKIHILKQGEMSRCITETKFNKLKRRIKNFLKRNNTEAVISTTVNQLCTKYQITELDFISLDVEGMEYDVLQGINFDRIDVLAILIECRPHNFMNITERMYASNFVLAEAVTRFNENDNPNWDGTHQDYLFFKKDFYLFNLNS